MLNKEAISIYEGLQVLSTTTQFPARVAFAIIRNHRLLLPIVQDFEDVRNGIVKMYGEPTEEDPSIFSIKPENRGDATKEINDLLEVEVPVELYKINIKDLDSVDLNLQEMEALFPMLSEEES